VTLTAKDVAEIARLLEESEFDELHLEHEGFKLTLRRGAAGQRPVAQSAAAPAAARGMAAAEVSAEREPHGTPAAAAVDGVRRDVPAPLLGTFYRAPKPGAAPYIEVGSQVEPDTIIGIIEVMKLMNTVRAGVAGTVAEILVPDGALVEYGQVLLRVAPGPPL